MWKPAFAKKEKF